MLYAEYAFYVNNRKGLMMPVAEVMRQRGFRSVYLYNKETAEEIMNNGHSRGMSQYVPYSDCLFIDLDDPSFLPLALENLEKLGWRYSYFFSGSKGYHIQIGSNITYGYGLPALHKELALKVHPQADMSLYRSGSLFRLPGTIHQKTGKPKQYIGSGGRDLLLLPWHLAGEKPMIQFKDINTNMEMEDGDNAELKLTLNAICRHLENPPQKGHRTQTLWAIAKGLADGKLGVLTIKGLIERVNSSWGDLSLEDDTVTRVLMDCQRVPK